jgi:hypothetical protein
LLYDRGGGKGGKVGWGGKGREGTGREGKGREGRGREGKGIVWSPRRPWVAFALFVLGLF